MSLKQSSNEAENFHQKVKSFRRAFDLLSCPLPSALENIFFTEERVSEKFDVNLPLIGFTPFDALKPEANVARANSLTTDKKAGWYRNTDPERPNARKSQDEIQGKTTQIKELNQDRGVDRLQVNTSTKKYGSGKIMAINAPVRSTSRVQQIMVRNTSSEKVEDHHKKPIVPSSGVSELPAAASNKASSRESLPGSSNSSQLQARERVAVENTLTVVDNLAQQILHDEHQACARQKEGHSSLHRPSPEQGADKQLQKGSMLSAMTSSLPMPQGDTLSPKEQQNDPRKRSNPANSYRRVKEKALSKEAHFNEKNFTNNSSYKALANSLSQIGLIADALLQSSTIRHRVKVKEENVSIARGDDRVPWDSTGLSASTFNRSHKVNLQQRKESPSNSIGSVPEPIFTASVSTNAIDKDAIATFVNEVLVEQATRHGVDLS
ncbi:MAG: hypothetical protein GY799_07455 [Desulfobulbaceae bacterium]|nr:hypothetical protein [Desulfobulbaceae bacterium]